MKIDKPIAVSSRTFSRHERLRAMTLEKFSNVRFNDEGLTLSGDALAHFIGDSVGVIVALEKLNESVLAKLPHLKYIAKYGVGLDNIDHKALEKYHVKLGWTGGVNARSVSELALSMMLGLLRNVFYTSRLLAAGEWKNQGGTQLSGKTVGVIGCGHIGKDFVRLIKNFGCTVLINDLLPLEAFCRQEDVRQVEKDELFEKSDVVTLHVPYTEQTHHLISSQSLSRMKASAILINTSRGNIVDESALYSALKNNQLGGAAMDVFAVEPPGNSPLLTLPNFVGTPHIGGSSAEAILAMGTAAINNLFNLISSDS